MLNLLLRPLRFLAQALTGNDSPRQTAWGFALGMMVGLLPKGNLLAIGAGDAAVRASSVNRAAGLLAIGVFSYVGWALDDFAHRLGALVLTWEPAQPTFTWLYDSRSGRGSGSTTRSSWASCSSASTCSTRRIELALRRGRRACSRAIIAVADAATSVIRWLRGAELGAQWGFEG